MTSTHEERLAVVEQKIADYNDNFTRHVTTCAQWQEQMYKKLDRLASDMQHRLPLWATCAGGLLLAVIGWLANAQIG